MNWVLLIALSVSFVVDQGSQDADVAELKSSDEALWLDPEQSSGLVLRRSPRAGDEHGSVLILNTADLGVNAVTHANLARRELPFHGWHTYFARLPHPASSAADDVVPGLVRGYVELARAGGPAPLVVIAEGSTGLACVDLLEELALDGLVLINLPAQGVPHDLLQSVALPSLVLQENPRGWPKENPLGPDVELHLLAKVDARREDNRLLRKIRGWFKRRFDA